MKNHRASPCAQWTNERIDFLTQQWNAGITPDVIAAELKVTPKAVSNKASRIGLCARRRLCNSNPEWNDLADIELRRAWRTGETVDAIAARLGFTPGSILWRAKKLELVSADHRARLAKAREAVHENGAEASTKAQDDAFMRAMRNAISKGLESPNIGIVTTAATRCPRFVATVQIDHQLGQSSIAACGE